MTTRRKRAVGFLTDLRRRAVIFRRYLRIADFPFKPIMRRIAGGEILLFASAISFSVLLTMIPFLLISASALGIILRSSEGGLQSLGGILSAVFPSQPFASSIRDSIEQIIRDIVTYRASIGLVGFVVLVLTATFLFDVVRTVLHRVYGIKRKKNLFKSVAHDIVFVFLAWLLLIASNLTLWSYAVFENLALRIPELGGFNLGRFLDEIPNAIVYMMIVFMFYIVYGHLTDEKPPRAAAIASTVTMSVLWILSAKLFALYVGRFSAISIIYGGYAFMLVLLIWIYYSSLVFVIGAITGQVYWETLKAADRRRVDRRTARIRPMSKPMHAERPS